MTQLLDILQKIFTIAAIAAGGLWAYFHYFRRRVYKPRLEPAISGKVISKGSVCYLMTIAKLKNVGLSKVKIEQNGSGLRVLSIDKQPGIARTCTLLEGKRLATFPVFKHHKWIESGEPIEDHRLIGIPSGNQVAFRLKLRIVAKKISWRTDTIIEWSST